MGCNWGGWVREKKEEEEDENDRVMERRRVGMRKRRSDGW